MKYIITEDRLDEFLTNYLNSWVKDMAVSHTNPFIIISRKIEDFEDWDDYMEYDYSDGRLWINKNFKNLMMDMSNKSEVGVRVFIGKWFEDKFNVDIKYVE